MRVTAFAALSGRRVVLLLCGGGKSDQSRDIMQAINCLNDWKKRGKP